MSPDLRAAIRTMILLVPNATVLVLLGCGRSPPPEPHHPPTATASPAAASLSAASATAPSPAASSSPNSTTSPEVTAALTKLLPPGSGWWCSKFRCWRTKAECDEREAKHVAKHPGDVHECVQFTSAWCFASAPHGKAVDDSDCLIERSFCAMYAGARRKAPGVDVIGCAPVL